MTGGHHGSLAGRFFQVAGLGSAGAGAGLGAPPFGVVALPLVVGETAGGAVGLEPAPSAGEGRGAGEDEGVLAGADAGEAGGIFSSTWPSAAGGEGATGCACAEAGFTLSAGAETTALAGTVTVTVGGWSLMSSRVMWTVGEVSTKGAGSLAGRSGAGRSGGTSFATAGLSEVAAALGEPEPGLAVGLAGAGATVRVTGWVGPAASGVAGASGRFG
ncbi:MAG: hypothetical protein EBS05_23815 [Proteobacteria bacterium]|nr:hypothetical protein [Pseudomonadota bacterium]